MYLCMYVCTLHLRWICLSHFDICMHVCIYVYTYISVQEDRDEVLHVTVTVTVTGFGGFFGKQDLVLARNKAEEYLAEFSRFLR